MNRHVLLLLSLGCLLAVSSLPAAEVMISRADAEVWFRLKTLESKGKIDYWAQFVMLQKSKGKGDAKKFPSEEVLGFKPIDDIDFQPSPPPTFATVAKKALWPPRIRATHDDVVSGEDPTVKNPKKSADDREGAIINFVHDGIANTDTWSVKGALIAPFIFDEEVLPDFKPDYWGFVPSVSLHRVTTDGDPKDEVDQLVYRIGLFATWINAPFMGSDTSAFHFRGYGTWATDTSHETEVPAGEFDLEPQWFWSEKAAIGYRMRLIPKDPPADDEDDNTLLGLKIRTWLHGEYGTVKNDGGQAAVQEGDFFRLGPSVRVQFDPFFHKRLKLSAGFDWLPDIDGESAVDTRWTAGAEWTVLENKEQGYQVSLKLDYVNGFEDLTHKDLDTLKIGLGVTF